MHYSTYIKITCLSNRSAYIFKSVHINTMVHAVDEIYPRINKSDLNLNNNVTHYRKKLTANNRAQFKVKELNILTYSCKTK